MFDVQVQVRAVCPSVLVSGAPLTDVVPLGSSSGPWDHSPAHSGSSFSPFPVAYLHLTAVALPCPPRTPWDIREALGMQHSMPSPRLAQAELVPNPLPEHCSPPWEVGGQVPSYFCVSPVFLCMSPFFYCVPLPWVTFSFDMHHQAQRPQCFVFLGSGIKEYKLTSCASQLSITATNI